MGYDVSLQVDVGGPEPVRLDILDENYTFNCGRMLYEAVGVGLADLSGEPAHKVAGILDTAITHMERDPERFRALNPDNGWGDADGWLRFLVKIRDACRLAPNARFVA